MQYHTERMLFIDTADWKMRNSRITGLINRTVKRAKITEIYESIQGEGLYVGERQLFVRFYGCNLSCKFCDERQIKRFREYTSQELYEELIVRRSKIISFTGGEPLLYSDFLADILPILKRHNIKIYLETNGTLKDRLLTILNFVDIISMDMKLPSSTGLDTYWGQHLEFLKVAREKEIFVKAVVTNETTLADIKQAIIVIKKIDKNIPFIIQPVSYDDVVARINLLPVFINCARSELTRVRVIPQVHKILGVR